MALTPSNMLDLGIKAPDFSLIDVVENRDKSFADTKGKNGTVVMFICNHCPFVIHVFDQLVAISNEYKEKGIGFVAISSNDVENYPADSPDKMAELSKELDFSFPYLYDKTQKVAKAYDAACTPDFYVFDQEDILVYRGRLDESRPGNDKPLNGADLRSALDAVIGGNSVSDTQYPSMGCNIKWLK